ncbi:MAG TPA: exodeoxyribonuclease VII small subunit [Balneolaceae bacterium]|nr:exodeoxyribonuclease VII small subunit [Balneolaceae bacterium]
MSDTERQSFEDALSRLEAIVNELEDESIPLEKSIELYEEGIELSKMCTDKLEKAELRIKKVASEQSADEKENK